MTICDTLRLVGTPGTNKVMMGELNRLAQRALSTRPATPQKAGTGTLVYPYEPALAQLAVSYHRTATRVLWDLFASDARRLEPLYQELYDDMRRDRRAWCWDGATISVHARNLGGFAAGERQVVGTVKNALIDGASQRHLHLRVDAKTPDISIAVRMHDHTVYVSIDLAGASLSRRGYRTARSQAPIREHLAAVLLMLARYDPRSEILLDPMCGSGTICIEGALIGCAAPLWMPPRTPALWKLPEFRQRTQTHRPLFADTQPLVVGNEIDSHVSQMARDNASAAGATVIWLRGHFRTLARTQVENVAGGQERSGSGLILCNPPYGHRVGHRHLSALYRDLSDWCDQFRGWRAGFLVANPAWQKAFGRKPRIRKSLNNGSLPAYFYLYDL